VGTWEKNREKGKVKKLTPNEEKFVYFKIEETNYGGKCTAHSSSCELHEGAGGKVQKKNTGFFIGGKESVWKRGENIFLLEGGKVKKKNRGQARCTGRMGDKE